MEYVAKQRYSCNDCFPTIRYRSLCNGHILQELYGGNLQNAVIKIGTER